MIEYSREVLYHYRCGSCNQWWSIADMEPPPTMICAYCGHWQAVKKIDESEKE